MWKVRIMFGGMDFAREFVEEKDALFAHADLLGDLRGEGPLTAIQTLRPDGTPIRTTSKSGEFA